MTHTNTSNANLYSTVLESNQSLDFQVKADRHAWLHLVDGKATINGETITSGDAVSFEPNESLEIKGLEESEFLLFDLA